MTDTPVARTSKTVDNPWREFIENVISGKNYFRVSEYHELLTDLDRLYALEEKHATQTAVVHMGIDDQPHDGRRIDCVKCHSDETKACGTCGDDTCSGYHAELRPALKANVVHMGANDQPHEGRRADCARCSQSEGEQHG